MILFRHCTEYYYTRVAQGGSHVDQSLPRSNFQGIDCAEKYSTSDLRWYTSAHQTARVEDVKTKSHDEKRVFIKQHLVCLDVHLCAPWLYRNHLEFSPFRVPPM